MRKEKIIRSQARNALSGNWTSAIAGVFVLVSVILSLIIFYTLILCFLGLDDEKIKKGTEVTILIILASTFLVSFALTPFKNGYYRLCYNIATGRSDGLRDLFYFFSRTKLYFKALQFNIMMSFRFILNTIVGLIPYFVCLLFKELFFDKKNTTLNLIGDVLLIILMSAGIAFAIICSIKLIAYNFVFVDNCEANVYRVSRAILRKHATDYYKLVFSFVFWILSCFFILPGLYVIPYFTTSLGMTSKWLITLYKEGKTV